MGCFMIRIYFFVGVVAVLSEVYFMALNIGRSKCVADMSANTVQIAQQQLKKQEEINVEIYRTNVRDIRDILRAKYTIAE